MRTEDGYIIQQCLDGNAAAFGFLVNKYKEPVYALAYSRVHNFHDAQDITQEVFIKAYRKLRDLRRWDSFMGWLCRITNNMCKDWLRLKAKCLDKDYVEDQRAKTLDHISMNSYRENMLYESINDSLESLPDIYREVLSLRYFGGMNIREMSIFLGISSSTIDRRLREAMSRLKEETFAMMNAIKEKHELPGSFTFRIVEIIKHVRIKPIPSQRILPWGISIATGLMIAVLGVGMRFNINNIAGYETILSSAGGSKVLKIGEIPVDVLGISDVTVISSKQLPGDGLGNVVPDLQNALFMALQADGGTWTKKADMLTATASSAACMVNGKIYVIGGAPNNVDSIATVQEYEPIANKWNKKADMPTARGYLTASVVDGKIYAIGGSIKKNAQWFELSTVEEYNPATNEWTKKADMPTARGSLSSSAVNGRIYAIGGYENKNGQWAILSTVEEYNPATDKWTDKTDMPTGRSYLSVCTVDGRIYAIGGSNLVEGLSAVEEYDPVSDEWSIKTNMPTARADLTASVVNGKIYAIGGVPLLIAGSLAEEYDPSTDMWKKMSNMLTARISLSSCATNNRLYAIGGQIQGDLGMIAIPTVEEYDPGTGQGINFKGKLPTTWGDVRAD